MKLEKKPKCSGCAEVLDDNFYWWWPDQRGKSGQLLHTRCAVTRQDTLERVLKGLVKLKLQIRERLNKA